MRPLPNSPAALDPAAIPRGRVWAMLALRSVVSFGLVLAVAAGLAVRGHARPFGAAAAWWLWFVTVTNGVSLALLVRFAGKEGLRLRDIYFARRETWRGDLLWLVVGLAGTAAFAQAPGTWLAARLWGDPAYPNTLLFQPLPVMAVYPLFALMPTIHALAELPVYWGYVAPRLRAFGWGRLPTIALVGAALSVQHLFFAFQPDGRYALWLAVKFLPFALWTGFLVDRRPTVLPYLMAGHFLLDALLPALLLMVAQGRPLG